MPLDERARYDPPLLRHRFVTLRRLGGRELLAATQAGAGWEDARIESMLEHGGLHLDGRPHPRGELPASVPAGTRVDAYAFAREPEPVPFGADRVLEAGADWIAVDKPAWMTTQATRASRRLSLEACLRERIGCPALVAVHRLDRETTGVVLLAMTREAAARLGRAFAAGGARKRYRALVAPAPRMARFEVSGWLGRVLDPHRYRFALRDAPVRGFRWSHSRFAQLGATRGGTLLACEPTTGRSHQLRVHLAAAGASIVGDALYGGAVAERLALHAEELELEGERIAVRAPLPEWAG
jgi:23S rRNA-/tRNA-specific pseudouridylate synthase